MPELAMDRIRRLAESRSGEGPGWIGSSILSAISIAEIHSLTTPSYETMREWAENSDTREAAQESLNTALALELAASTLAGFAFDDYKPAVVAGGLSLILFLVGQNALRSPIGSV